MGRMGRALAPMMLWTSLWAVPAGCAHQAHVTRMPEVPPPVPALPADAPDDVVEGAHLYRVAGCVGCHSPPFADAVHLGGGRDLPTMFGVFYAPNISPDPVHGIGGWTEADFARALREGRAPDGHRYWPTFPYMAYTHMSDDDVHKLWVYLQSQPPVDAEPPPHEVRAPYSAPGMLGLWRGVAFHRGPLDPEPAPDHADAAAWDRGRYLVFAVGYCDQCHTPRGKLGLLQRRHLLAGGANPGKGDVHPNLTPDPTHGLGGWTVDDLASFLATGVEPDGSHTDPTQVMDEKIRDSYSAFSLEDRRAIATFLASLPPDDFDPEQWRVVRRARRRGE